jgi:hypothetical protein
MKTEDQYEEVYIIITKDLKRKGVSIVSQQQE